MKKIMNQLYENKHPMISHLEGYAKQLRRGEDSEQLVREALRNVLKSYESEELQEEINDNASIFWTCVEEAVVLSIYELTA